MKTTKCKLMYNFSFDEYSNMPSESTLMLQYNQVYDSMTRCYIDFSDPYMFVKIKMNGRDIEEVEKSFRNLLKQSFNVEQINLLRYYIGYEFSDMDMKKLPSAYLNKIGAKTEDYIKDGANIFWLFFDPTKTGFPKTDNEVMELVMNLVKED